MKNLLICLETVENWKTLGLQLDIPNDELIRIKSANQSNPDCCKESMLKHWLWKKENPSWMTLASALEDMDLLILANKIQTKYPQVREEIFLMLDMNVHVTAYMYLHRLIRNLFFIYKSLI